MMASDMKEYLDVFFTTLVIMAAFMIALALGLKLILYVIQ